MTLKSSISPKNFVFILFASVTIIAFSSSCNKSCQSFGCVYGNCESGVCNCDSTFDGPSCNSPWNAKFVGKFEGKDCYENDNVQYTFGAGAKSSDTIVINSKWKAHLIDAYHFEMKRQPATLDGVDYEIEGSGSINTDKDLILFKTTSYFPNNLIKPCSFELGKLK